MERKPNPGNSERSGVILMNKPRTKGKRLFPKSVRVSVGKEEWMSWAAGSRARLMAAGSRGVEEEKELTVKCETSVAVQDDHQSSRSLKNLCSIWVS